MNKQQTDLKIDIGELMKEVQGKVQPQLVEGLLKEIQESLSWKLSDKTAEAVNEFLENEIKPEMEKCFIKHKQAILDGIETTFKDFGKELGKAMQKHIVGKFAEIDSWKLKKIIEEIL